MPVVKGSNKFDIKSPMIKVYSEETNNKESPPKKGKAKFQS
jgi:hypothetical protein